MKIAVAMSGGVDSTVAADRLKKEGHDVFGVTMLLRPDASRADAEDARRAADALGVRHYVIDLRDEFNRTVIDYFCREYRQGRTPNPCVLCNRRIKFGALWEKARELGAERMATGHYAGIELKNGRYLLQKGADRKKDQSYFLNRLTQEQLGRTLFPLAQLTKDKVKETAAAMGLPAAERRESQEICFIPDNNYAGFIKKISGNDFRPGEIIDREGKRLGEHQSILHYTIGQRKGIGLAAPEPLYVTAIDPARNTVTVGGKEDTYTDEIVVKDINWIAIAPPQQTIKAKVKVRYRHPEAPADVIPLNEQEARIKFSAPVMAVAPGQAAVFYDGETVLGGGTIVKQGR